MTGWIWVGADKFVDLFKTTKLAQGVSLNVTRRDMRCQYGAAVRGEAETAVVKRSDVRLRHQVLCSGN